MDWLLELFLNGPLFDWLNDLLHAEVTKMTIAFMIASEVHSRKVKKEFGLLRQSIDHVAEVTERRFKGFEDRLTRIEQRSNEE